MTYWIFLIAAVVVAIFSNKIEQAAQCDGKLRNLLLILCAGVLITINIPPLFRLF
ncbi:protein CrcB-like protein [Bacilliculturomica massiliensis]|uniref:protein CrcB-like protein n=1 Tax=Bacilliculturomica massiliensis TaxID=1917867 RepID=UPI00103003E0|nr:protein CrcB-like protein [Bacilliculturomica massiliensis]